MGWPDEIIHSYQEVIGRPAMPPYWALGFHQCRQGYKNLEEVREVVGNFSANQVLTKNRSIEFSQTPFLFLYPIQIPLDGIWLDVDYMDNVII